MGLVPLKYSLFLKAYLPMATLFILIAFIYLTYLKTYLVELLTDNYDFQTKHDSSTAPVSLLMIHSISHHTNNFVEYLTSFSALAYSSVQRKGVFYTIALHFLLLMFIIATIRVIKTNPGSVPDDWNNETEKDLCDLVEAEKKILRNIRRQVKRRKNQEEEERKLLESSKDEVKMSSNDDGAVEEESKAESHVILIEGSVGQGQGGTMKLNESGHVEDTANEQLSEFDSEEEDEEERKNSDKVHQLAVMSALKRGNKRYCGHCQKFKPERAHHCRQCGTCVLKMDHHCPWVSNCVGFYNYKFFMNMVFYGDLLLLLAAITYSELVKDAIFNPKFSSFELYIILLNYILTWFLAIVILVFFCFHLGIILQGKTTLEFCEKKKNTKYDFGRFANLQRVFGKNVLLWAVPCSAYTEGQGVHFK